jgi:urease accessory protein
MQLGAMPFAAVSDPEAGFSAATPRLQRTEGAAAVRWVASNRQIRLARLHQSGAAKVRLPKSEPGEPPQAVLINTAGGLTGGDRLLWDLSVSGAGRAVTTTQACEKVYRSSAGDAEVAATLSIGEGARLDWLPQETILFDGARLSRRLEAELGAGATLLAVEATLFGRAARGERIRSGGFADRWRIRRQGRLVFADDLRFDWARDAGLLDRPAVLSGGAAAATVLLVAEEPERHLSALRAIIGDAGGASAWNGKLLARIVAEGGAALRRVLVPALVELLDGAALPKIWRM